MAWLRPGPADPDCSGRQPVLKRRKPIPETVLAEAVIRWLKADGWDVYQEIETEQGGPRADIVAVKDEVVWVIEVKRSLTFDLLGQASRWKFYAHRVSVAVPGRKRFQREDGARRYGMMIAERTIRAEGIGLIRLEYSYPNPMEVAAWGGIKPKDREDAPDSPVLLQTLTPAHKDFAAAGNATGKRLTKFGMTAIRVLEAVKAAPGHTVKDVVAVIDHHYASDRGAAHGIRSGIKSGWIEGVRIEASGKEYRLYPKETGKNGTVHDASSVAV